MPDGDWHRSRAYHRQMYIDLVRAYLSDYGSQAKLARALGVTEAYVSYLMTPLRQVDQRRNETDWYQASLARDVAGELRWLKSPSPRRAMEIAGEVCSDRERRDLLLHHMQRASELSAPTVGGTAPLDEGEIDAVLLSLGHTHQIALHTNDPKGTRTAYRYIWEAGTRAAQGIAGRSHPLQYAQLMLFVHDAASVLDRDDIGLGYARAARAAVASRITRGSPDDTVDRLLVNTLLAEAVSLNSLGLGGDALRVSRQAELLRGFSIEPDQWKRSFLEQQMTAWAAMPRVSVYHAEKLADDTQSLVPDDPILRAGALTRLANIFVAHGTPRSIRKARDLVEPLHAVAMGHAGISPLRKAQILRALIGYFHRVRDSAAKHDVLVEFLLTTEAANLPHQRDQLSRQLNQTERAAHRAHTHMNATLRGTPRQA